MQPIDQGAIIRSGMALVPDYGQLMMQQRQMGLQEQQLGNQTAQVQMQQAKLQDDMRNKAAFSQRLAQISALPHADQAMATVQLMREFPDMAEGLKRSFDAQGEVKAQADFSQMSQIYSAVKNNRVDLAIAQLKQRTEADRAAGLPDDQDNAVLAMLESGDKGQISQAMSMIGTAMAAVDRDKFAAVSGIVNPAPTNLQREAEYIGGQAGDMAKADYIRNQYDPFMTVATAEGTSVGPQSYFTSRYAPGANESTAPVDQGSRGRPVSNASEILRQVFPDAVQTSGYRGPNHPLSKKNPGSFHARTHAAVDVRPMEGVTFDQFVQRFRDRGYSIIEAKNEVGAGRSAHATGDHWHIVLGAQSGGQAGRDAPIIRSKQQFAALPSGSIYIAPDGSKRRKR